jgi:hypothetical protein
MDESEEIIKLKEIIKSRDLQIAELLHEIQTLKQIGIEETLDNVEVIVDNSDEPILTLIEEEEEQLPDIMNMVNMFMGNSANPFSEIMKKMMVSEEEKEEDEDEDEEDKEE